VGAIAGATLTVAAAHVGLLAAIAAGTPIGICAIAAPPLGLCFGLLHVLVLLVVVMGVLVLPFV
jgi:hypothetical protein